MPERKPPYLGESAHARAVIFDLDGTLAHTLPDIAMAINVGRATFGLPPCPQDQVRGWIGEGLPTLCERALRDAPHAPLDRMIHTVGEYYRAHSLDTTAPFPGIAVVLTELTNRSIPMSVCTNKPHQATLLMIDALFDRSIFVAVEGYTQEDRRKPDPRTALEIAARMKAPPEHVIFLGDSATDMLTATNAGMIPVGVTWGYRSRDELRRSDAAAILDRPSQLLDLLPPPPP
jgi:phosphoglycolate phosphatase